MNRPGTFTYLCGNAVVALASLAVLGLTAVALLQGRCNIVPVVVAAVIAARCWQCAGKVRAYNRWQKEWSAMNGAAVPRRSGDIFASAPWLRWPVIVVLWLVCGIGAINSLQGSAQSLATAWVLLGLLCFAGYGLFKLLRGAGGRKPNASGQWDDVASLLRPPVLSADARRISPLLPDYCRQIL